MVKKGSYLIPCDKSGVKLVRVFHLYKGFNRKTSFLGDFVKVSVRDVKFGSPLRKKAKLKAFLIRTKNWTKKCDGSIIKFKVNNAILLKKRTTSVGKRITGPILKLIKRRKLLSSFSKIL
uniref:ribosomal protein L14 n=1 Tax=Cryptocaryon irritans TaxID=153251 RepID=UPI0022FD6524|nr:ribosomal protein L14 [Cryptocaryon irritans]WBP62326.1 ribosomal protein L14 [Cryptocaryon irritans]